MFMYLSPFKFRLPLIFATRAQIRGRQKSSFPLKTYIFGQQLDLIYTNYITEIPESFLIAFDQESLDEIAAARKCKSLLESFMRDGAL